MISPSPTQQPPEQTSSESRKIEYASRQRSGQTPTARFFKAIFRPIFRGIYYLLRGMRNHKLITFIMVLLIIGSAIVANYALTSEWPFGIGNDPFNFHINGGNGGGEQVQNWLYAMRDGNITALNLLDKDMSQPPNVQQLVSQFSQPNGHLTWKTINVISVFQESDTTVDSLVQVDLSATGPGGNTSGYLIWHFVTVPQNGGVIINATLVDFRAPLG
ncbi:MAG TPA: hypothetical protein VNW73_17870 [Ktedonobacteraceae bacterium]|nr:hypothetical protein [Ktedonobacteraceae bacterium]